MSLVPSGRLSAIETERGVLQIQTEFSVNPNKNIVTSHIFSGRVVRKKETAWQSPLENDRDRLKAEENLALQHRHEVEFAISNWEGMITPVIGEIEQATSQKRMQSLKTKLAGLKGIKKVLLLDQEFDYLVIKNETTDDDFHGIEFAKQALSLAEQISSVIRIGKLLQFSAGFKEDQHLLQVWGDKFLLFQTELGCDLSQVKTNIQLALAGV